MKFKEFLEKEINEDKIKFNLDNYSGSSETVDICSARGTFKSRSYSGTFKKLGTHQYTVTIKDYEEFPISVYKAGGAWVAYDEGMTREDANPIVAALKLAANIF